MVDFGATGNFINHQTTLNNRFRLIKKKRLYHLFVLDGNAIGSLNRQVTFQIDKLIMKTLQKHIEDIKFDITNLGTHKLVLNMP